MRKAHEMTGFGRRVGSWPETSSSCVNRKLAASVPRTAAVLFPVTTVCRLLVPFAMLAALSQNLFLLSSPLYVAILSAQLFFYALAAAGAIWRLRPKPLMLPYYFCMINVATFFGLYHALTDPPHHAWK